MPWVAHQIPVVGQAVAVLSVGLLEYGNIVMLPSVVLLEEFIIGRDG